jgi:GNAT superfamily N-acetyltransferase
MTAPTAESLTETWNRAIGGTFPLQLAVARQFLSVDVDDDASGVAPGGFVVAKRWESTGYIGALVVEPHVQGGGLGKRLLRHAINAFQRNGVREVLMGGDRLHLVPGVPEPGPLDLCRQMGVELENVPVADLRRSLHGWRPSSSAPPVRPASNWAEVLEFLGREFPGRWVWEAEEAARRGGDPGGHLLLEDGGAVVGFARVQHGCAGSAEPGLIAPSAYWKDLLDPAWGGIGPLGLAEARRGRGLGLSLLEAAMDHLQKAGVRDLVVDWARTEGLYSRGGLTPWRIYRPGRLVLY